ncbi:MAG TPA: ATP-binding cassette domain-containing protein [Tepidiformaceae bacterium]|nr:ATP-binding cassette domain-containing protein [Tepidiformaceae bacterium]
MQQTQTAPAAARPSSRDGVIIRTRDLTKRYGGPIPVLAVDGLNLEVCEGEIFGLLGPNGAGKTTTIGMLTTRVKPTGGQAFIGAVDVAQRPAVAKRFIGVVTQTNSLDRSLNVAENLYYHGLYFGLSSKDSHRRTDELLELFLLRDRAKSEVDQLSGGMAQRLMIARALVHDPPILFLDEPTSGIDPQTRLALWDIIRELNSLGHTVLLTTHYMEEAERLCDRVAIMDHGHLLANDTPESLKQGIGAETVVELHVQGNETQAQSAIERLPGVTRIEGDGPNLRIYARGDPIVVPKIVAAAAEAGSVVQGLAVSPPTLETVFIQLTGRELRE